MKPLRSLVSSVYGHAIRPTLRLVLGITEALRSWVHDPYQLMVLRGIGFIMVVAGAAGIAHSLLVRIPERVGPILHPAMTLASGTGCDKTFGGRYAFVLDGHHWSCSGADWGCVTEKSVPVVYNRYNPNQCRRADRVGKLSLRDWVAVVTKDSFFALTGLGLLLVHGYDQIRWRRILVRTVLLLGLAMLLLMAVWSLANAGDRLRMGRATGNPYSLF